MVVREVEGVHRIRVSGRRRHVRVDEGRAVGPRRPGGGTVPVRGVAGDARGGRRPREGGPCGGHAGGLESGGGGRSLGGGGGKGMEDGGQRVPVGGRGQGGRPLLSTRRAGRDVLFVGGNSLCLRPRRVRYALAASRRHRAGGGRGHQGRVHELAGIHRCGGTGVNGRRVGNARSDDLVQRAGERHARIVGDRSLQERARGNGYGDCDAVGRRLAVLPVVEGDVTRVVQEGQRLKRPRPGAVHVVRYLRLPGSVVLGKPPDQQIPLSDRTGECDGDRRRG